MMQAGSDGIRIILAVVVGVIIALAIFLGLNKMLSRNAETGAAGAVAQLVNYVNTPRQIKVQHKQLVKPPPPPPQQQPPPKQVQMKVSKNVPTQRLPVKVDLDVGAIGGGSLYIGPNNGPATNASGYAPLTPMARFTPLYPPQAQVQGVTGTVNTCFTVEPDGSVANPYVKHASSPAARRLLSQGALEAIRQWKFFPQKVNGKPVAAPACQVIQFKIGNSQ